MKYIGFSLTIDFNVSIVIITIFNIKYNILGVAKCERGGWEVACKCEEPLTASGFYKETAGNKYTSNARMGMEKGRE